MNRSAQPAPTSSTQNLARSALGAMLTLAGVSHLTFARRDFQAQVPNVIPLPKDFVVVASGVVEIALGLSLLFSRRRRVPVGLVAASFFVAVFPGNVAQYLNHADAFGLDTDGKRLARLFMQPPLVAWALWSTGALSWLREKQPQLARHDESPVSAKEAP